MIEIFFKLNHKMFNLDIHILFCATFQHWKIILIIKISSPNNNVTLSIQIMYFQYCC